MDHRGISIRKILASALLIFPSVLVIAFVMHIHSANDLFNFKFERPTYDSNGLFESLVSDNGAGFIHSHAIAYLSVPFMVLTMFCLGKILYVRKPVLAFIGATVGVVGALFMAGFFGAWLSFSAVAQVEPEHYIGAKATLDQLTRSSGVLKVITQLSFLSLIGIIILSMGCLTIKLLPKWSPISIVIGCLIILIFMGLPNWMLVGSMLIFIGLIPFSKFYNIQSTLK
jgi:hypothetical protein